MVDRRVSQWNLPFLPLRAATKLGNFASPPVSSRTFTRPLASTMPPQETGVMEVESLQATPEMVVYCFEVLLYHLKGGDLPKFPFDGEVQCPLFVTWEKDGKNGNRQLRGCIGTLSPKSLTALKDYTYSSAFRDRRFQPIAENEVPRLKCSVSLLVNYEQATNAWDWEVGVHGIIIAFKGKKGEEYSATYLPEVAAEQGWTKDEALESLVRKAGYTGKLTTLFFEQVSLTRYQSSKFSLHYNEYEVLRAARVTAL